MNDPTRMGCCERDAKNNNDCDTLCRLLSNSRILAVSNFKLTAYHIQKERDFRERESRDFIKMNDPTRMSCCERDAKNNEKNMKIYNELVKRDPTRIAVERRKIR